MANPPSEHLDILVPEAARLHNRPSARPISRQTQWLIYSLLLVFNDVVMMIVAFRFAYFVRFSTGWNFFQVLVVPNQVLYETLILFLVPVWVLIFWVSGLYNRAHLMGGTEEYSLVFRASSISLLLLVLLGFLDPNILIARGWLLLTWFFSFFFTALGRFILRRVVFSLRRLGYYLSPTLIVGANVEGITLARQLAEWRSSGLDVVGFVDKKTARDTLVFGNLRILGDMDQLDDIVERYDIEELVLATSAVSSHDNLLEIFKRYGVSDDVHVRMSSGLYEIITTGLTVKEFASVPLFGVNQVRLTGVNRFLKFLLDYAIALPATLLALPLLIGITIAIKLDSPGPAIHKRRVMGVNGKQFDAYKFRTMYVNGDEILSRHPDLKRELESNHKLKTDPRITRIGGFLRKFSLDELPQIINVFKREMSVVGPRMISPEEMRNYSQWGINLLTIRPGITGLWQVSGRSDISYSERVRLDMYYIRNWSIWLDLQLILRTIPAVMRSRGAY
jgi:exopolysaccharide biosynthesis polyprenyl glycosylphosphotransferase